MGAEIIEQGILEKLEPDTLYIVINPQDRDDAIKFVQERIAAVCEKAADSGMYGGKDIDVEAYRQANIGVHRVVDETGAVKALALASSDPRAPFDHKIYEVLFHKGVRQIIATTLDDQWKNATNAWEILGHAGFLEKVAKSAPVSRPAQHTLLSRLAAIAGYGQSEQKQP